MERRRPEKNTKCSKSPNKKTLASQSRRRHQWERRKRENAYGSLVRLLPWNGTERSEAVANGRVCAGRGEPSLDELQGGVRGTGELKSLSLGDGATVLESFSQQSQKVRHSVIQPKALHFPLCLGPKF